MTSDTCARPGRGHRRLRTAGPHGSGVQGARRRGRLRRRAYAAERREDPVERHVGVTRCGLVDGRPQPGNARVALPHPRRPRSRPERACASAMTARSWARPRLVDSRATSMLSRSISCWASSSRTSWSARYSSAAASLAATMATWSWSGSAGGVVLIQAIGWSSRMRTQPPLTRAVVISGFMVVPRGHPCPSHGGWFASPGRC